MADPERASRVVDIQASYDGRVARWVLHDQGAGFDAQAVLSKLDGEEPDLLKAVGPRAAADPRLHRRDALRRRRSAAGR